MTQLNFEFNQKGKYYLYIYCSENVLRDVELLKGMLPSDATLAQRLPVGYTATVERIA